MNPSPPSRPSSLGELDLDSPVRAASSPRLPGLLFALALAACGGETPPQGKAPAAARSLSAPAQAPVVAPRDIDALTGEVKP